MKKPYLKGGVFNHFKQTIGHIKDKNEKINIVLCAKFKLSKAKNEDSLWSGTFSSKKTGEQPYDASKID